MGSNLNVRYAAPKNKPVLCGADVSVIELDNYLRGASDCRAGKEWTDQGDFYTKGYSDQYAIEQVLGRDQ